MPRELKQAQLTIAATVFRHAEKEFALLNQEVGRIIAELKCDEGSELGADRPALLRIAAALPNVAAGLPKPVPSDWTPSHLHCIFSREMRRKVKLDEDGVCELKATMEALDLSKPEDLVEYVCCAYTLQLCRLFDFTSDHVDLVNLVERTAQALIAEEAYFGFGDGQTGFRGKKIALPDPEKTATEAVLVYNSAMRYYERYQRTISKQVLPNGQRAIEQAAAKKERQQTRVKEKAQANNKLKAKRISHEVIVVSSDSDDVVGFSGRPRKRKRAYTYMEEDSDE